VFNDEE
jgi:hypothetical protein